MEGLHLYDNPSYSKGKSIGATASNSTYVNNSDSVVPHKEVRNWKIATVAVIAVCVVIALAVGSIAIALVSYFNGKGEDSQITPTVIADMQAQIAKLTLDLNATQSHLSEVIMGNMREISGEKVFYMHTHTRIYR